MKSENTKAIAIVMARGGSKRIPRKNIRPFCGHPMVAWPVSHACRSGLFSEVIISTDDQAIADAAVAAGAACYGLRPETLSDDFAGTAEVLAYELRQYAMRNGAIPEYCCYLYGTSALASVDLLRKSLCHLQEKNAEALMTLIPYSHPVERAIQLGESGEVVYRHPEFIPMRTQDLRPSYHDSGLLYWCMPEVFCRHGGKSMLQLKRVAIVVSSHEVVDIDTEEDWKFAELLAHARGLEKSD